MDVFQGQEPALDEAHSEMGLWWKSNFIKGTVTKIWAGTIQEPFPDTTNSKGVGGTSSTYFRRHFLVTGQPSELSKVCSTGPHRDILQSTIK